MTLHCETFLQPAAAPKVCCWVAFALAKLACGTPGNACCDARQSIRRRVNPNVSSA